MNVGMSEVHLVLLWSTMGVQEKNLHVEEVQFMRVHGSFIIWLIQNDSRHVKMMSAGLKNGPKAFLIIGVRLLKLEERALSTYQCAVHGGYIIVTQFASQPPFLLS